MPSAIRWWLKGKASELFKELLTDIRMGVINRMFNVQPRRSNATAVERGG